MEHLVDDAEPAAPRHHDEHPVEVADGLRYEIYVLCHLKDPCEILKWDDVMKSN